MVKRATVEKWGFDEIKVKSNEDGEVVELQCIICTEYYQSDEDCKKMLSKFNGVVRSLVNKWIEGTTTIKKNNASDHLKAHYHVNAVRKLKEKAEHKCGEVGGRVSEAEKLAAEKQPSQPSILTNVRKLNSLQREQLLKKFQLVHFVTTKNLPFKMYEHFVKFERDTHKVDVGNAYLTDRSGREMLVHLSKSLLQRNVIDPLNTGARLYFSLLYDGSSSAKTNDEKELYLIKTCDKGRPAFDVLSLQEPASVDTVGLKSSMDKAVQEAKLTIPRKHHEIGVGSDGTSANKRLFLLEKQDVGDHLVFIWCSSHKLELAVKDAFKDVNLDWEAQQQLENEYYLFKKATLKWRLFKRYAEIEGKRPYRYKRPTGTRWLHHQEIAIDTHLRNLKTMLSFTNEQIELPYNPTMKKEKARLEGIRRESSSIKLLIYQAVKRDVVAYLVPCSLTLEKIDLILPEAITAIERGQKTVQKLHKKVEELGHEAFLNEDLFPTFNKEILPELKENQQPPVPAETKTRSRAQEPDSNTPVTFCSYAMRGDVSRTMVQVSESIKGILASLSTYLESRMSDITTNPLYTAAATLLDTKSYPLKPVDDVKSAAHVLEIHFDEVLSANGFDRRHLGRHHAFTASILFTFNTTTYFFSGFIVFFR